MARHTRRDFVRLATASAATVAVGSVATGQSSNTDDESGWTVADSPTEEPLNDAVDTAAGPVAVGASGNVVVRRESGWEKIVDYGPQARSRRLTGVDVTDDGAAVWFVGGSGVIGEYNLETRTLTNYSAPGGITSTWEDCAVEGTAGEDERLYFVNGSGELLVGTRQESGAVQYEDVTEPGGGSTIPGIDFHDRETGHVCSTSQFVAETDDGGESWDRIGIDFAGGAFFDVASRGARDVNVAAGSGIIYRYDGFRWTPHVVDDARQGIRAIDRDGDEGLAAGDAGKLYERRSAGQWAQYETPVEAELRGVTRSDSYDVAVGAGGTIVERPVSQRGATPEADGNSSNPAGNESTTNSSNATANEPRPSSNATASLSTSLSDASLSVEEYAEGEWLFE